MANSFFQFKQFRINQSRSAMKVGTDGVLLGAWARLTAGESVIDIGSGTGLISLMMAQRGAKRVLGLELDPDAVAESKENIANSPFTGLVQISHVDWREFQAEEAFQLAICNPPFFKGMSENSRSMARQDASLTAEDLFSGLKSVIDKNQGRIALIIPSPREEEYCTAAAKENYFLSRRCKVFPKPNTAAKRVLLELRPQQGDIIEESLIIEEFGRHQYSQAYKELTSAFYL